MKALSLQDWNELAERKLNRILKAAQQFPTLAKLGPKVQWNVEFKLVNRPTMTRLNSSFRGKRYPTDILSFPAIAFFRETGLLGEMVICLPTLKEQAKSYHHEPELELDVLLVHGILHLLGFDHELGVREAGEMAKWESKILKTILPSSKLHQFLGLIDRTYSGN